MGPWFSNINSNTRRSSNNFSKCMRCHWHSMHDFWVRESIISRSKISWHCPFKNNTANLAKMSYLHAVVKQSILTNKNLGIAQFWHKQVKWNLTFLYKNHKHKLYSDSLRLLSDTVPGLLDKKGGGRSHLLLSKTWNLLPPFFLSNELFVIVWWSMKFFKTSRDLEKFMSRKTNFREIKWFFLLAKVY
jgi:hypothetical protein